MREILIRVFAHNEGDLAEFEAVLREAYSKVICSGVYRNSREPMEGGLRAFYTCLKEDKP
jgi:hypothetical protein